MIPEVTYGTFPAAGYNQVPFINADPGRDVALNDEPLAGEGPEAQDPDLGPEAVQSSFQVPFDLKNIGLWLKLLFGAPVTVDNLDGTWTHTFKSGGDPLSASIELGHVQLQTPVYQMITGFRPGSIAFDMSRRGRAVATITGIAQAVGKSGATQDAAPTVLPELRFLNKRGTVKVNGAIDGIVTGGSFEFNHNLEAIEALRPDDYIEDVDYSRQIGRGNVAVRYTGDTALVTAMDTGVSAELDYGFIIDGAQGYHCTFNLPRVWLPQKVPPVNGPGGVAATYDWSASGAAPGEQLVQVTLKNDVAAY
jgi:hypothetical protein